jgi:hypothetical protein
MASSSRITGPRAPGFPAAPGDPGTSWAPGSRVYADPEAGSDGGSGDRVVYTSSSRSSSDDETVEPWEAWTGSGSGPGNTLPRRRASVNPGPDGRGGRVSDPGLVGRGPGQVRGKFRKFLHGWRCMACTVGCTCLFGVWGIVFGIMVGLHRCDGGHGN